MQLALSVLDSTFAVCRLPKDSPTPHWATQSAFYSVTKTRDELSIVVEQSYVPNEIKTEKNWKVFKVEGPLDFGLTGK